MEADIAEVRGQIASERALLAQCTDVKREEMIRQRLLALETSHQGLTNLLTELIRQKGSQPAGNNSKLHNIKS